MLNIRPPVDDVPPPPQSIFNILKTKSITSNWIQYHQTGFNIVNWMIIKSKSKAKAKQKQLSISELETFTSKTTKDCCKKPNIYIQTTKYYKLKGFILMLVVPKKSIFNNNKQQKRTRRRSLSLVKVKAKK